MQDPLKGAAPNRRQFLALTGLGALAAASGGALAGCGSDKPTGPGTTSASNLSKIPP